MIIEFKVKNYLSFKEEQILSFEASQDKFMQDYHCIDLANGERLLRIAMVYGANASGKTNLLLALDFLKNITTQSLDRESKTGFVPFQFDAETRNNPGYFEITLFINNTKYIYSVRLDDRIIYDEKLYFYPGTQPALVFHRQYNPKINDYTLKSGSRINIDSVELSVLKSNTLNNMTIVAGFKKTNIHFPELQTVYEWFEHGIAPIIRPWNNLYRNVIDKIENQEKGFKEFIIENLEIADFKIKNIDIELEDSGNDINNTTYGNEVQENYARYFKRKVVFTHEIEGVNNSLSVDFESSGTLRYLGLIGELKKSLQHTMVLNIDELENSLHPDLVNHFINSFLYYSKKENSKSQFIFTTHNINLLSEDFVRKDIVWFTEKDDTGSSNLYSLNDFNIRKNLSFLNAYKAGKFGAVPNLGIL